MLCSVHEKRCQVEIEHRIDDESSTTTNIHIIQGGDCVVIVREIWQRLHVLVVLMRDDSKFSNAKHTVRHVLASHIADDIE